MKAEQMGKPGHYFNILRQQRYPVRFIVSRLLMYSGLCNFITIRTPNYRMKFHPSTLAAMKWVERSERDEERLAKSYLRDGDAVVDVGANVGSFTLTAAKLVAPGIVYAYEAHPRIYKYLVENIGLNGLQNVRAINSAAGATRGSIRFTDKWSDVLNRVSEEGEIIVPLIPLDEDFKKTSGNIALMKIDVEGYELEVLKGAGELLLRCDCVLLEACSIHQSLFNYDSNDLIALLKPLGFSVFGCDYSMGEIYCFDGREIPHQFEDILFIRNVQDFLNRTGFSLSARNGS